MSSKNTGNLESHGIGDEAGKDPGEIRPDAEGDETPVKVIKQRGSMLISVYNEDTLRQLWEQKKPQAGRSTKSCSGLDER